MRGRLDTLGIDFLNARGMIEDHGKLGLVVGQLFVAQPESGEPRNMGYVNIDGHPLSVGALPARS